MSEWDEFVDIVKKAPRCVFAVEKSNPPLQIPRSQTIPTVHPRHIFAYGPTRFRWTFKDMDEDIDYMGTVRWKSAVFMGTHSAIIQYAFPYSIELPFEYDAEDGMSLFMRRYLEPVIKAGIGPMFVHNTLVRKGTLQPNVRTIDANKKIDRISFRDEGSAVVAAGLMDPTIRLYD